VTKILQELCGLEITSTQVSRAAADLDTMLEAWRQRPIPPISHLILDARYEKVRVGGTVRSCAVLSAIGIRREDGRRMILGVSVSLSEAEVHWREFLSSLKARGLPHSSNNQHHSQPITSPNLTFTEKLLLNRDPGGLSRRDAVFATGGLAGQRQAGASSVETGRAQSAR
jgi:hypothetical protein